MFNVRDVILQSRNNAHDLLAFLLQPAGFPLGRLEKWIIIIRWKMTRGRKRFDKTQKYLGCHTGCDELVGMLGGWQVAAAVGTLFFILAQRSADARARTLRHADVLVRTLATSRRRFNCCRLLVIWIGNRRTSRQWIWRRIESKNATQFVFRWVQIASNHSRTVGRLDGSSRFIAWQRTVSLDPGQNRNSQEKHTDIYTHTHTHTHTQLLITVSSSRSVDP